jgi:hypothetical protein
MMTNYYLNVGLGKIDMIPSLFSADFFSQNYISAA